MIPLNNEFNKFVTEVINFMEHTKAHIEFSKQQIIDTQIQVFALKNKYDKKDKEIK